MMIDFPNHRQFGPGYYCKIHEATFESQEAINNNAKCPWCGKDIKSLV